MGKFTEKELAARTAAYFNMWVINNCYTSEGDETTQEILTSGLRQNGTSEKAFELLEEISTSSETGTTFQLSQMTTIHSVKSQKLAEMFAEALLANAGSKEFVQTAFPEKDPEISAALKANSLPALASFFLPVYS